MVSALLNMDMGFLQTATGLAASRAPPAVENQSLVTV